MGKGLSKEGRINGQDYRKLWAEKLVQPKTPPPFKPPRVSVKPKCRVKRVNWCLPELHSVAQFLRSVSPEGPPCTVIEKIAETKAIYIIGTTLHVHVLELHWKDELNLISLATQFHIVDEVRIHNFHLNFYLMSRRVHVRIVPAYWRTVHFIFPYINRGPWVEKEGKKERAMKITFDEFLKPAVEAWKAGLPYRHLVLDIPEHETDLISTYINLPWVHASVSPFVVGYSLESDHEVDVVNDALDDDSDEDGEIMMILGYPFFPLTDW